MTMPDYLASPMVTAPYRLFDCCLETDGAAAIVVTSAERAKDLAKQPVYIMGGASGRPYPADDITNRRDIFETGLTIAAPEAFAMAGIRPADVHFAEIYDCFTITALLQMEDYGFCKRGEGGPFAEGGRLELGGEIPINTAGGLLSEGHLLGMGHIIEGVRQLRGGCGERQVKDPEVALVTGYGGGANVIWALGICFVISGDTPFVYDTLHELGRQKEFIGVIARGWAVQAAGNAVACVVGGVMMQWIFPERYDLTLMISSVIAIIGSITILTLKEPKADRTEMSSYRKHLREGWHKVVTTKAIPVIILFQIVIEIAIYIMAVFRSVYMDEDLHLNSFEIGVFIGGFTVFGGIMASQAGKIEFHLGEKKSLLFLLLTILISFTVVFLVASPLVILIQLPIYMVSYLQSPIIGGYINRRVDSDHRSTVVAISAFIFTAILTAVELPAGWFATVYGARNTMLVLALTCAPIGLFLLALWNREIDRERSEKKVRTLKQF